MYCPHCAGPITPGVSFCNRCGFNLKERSEPTNTGQITAFLTAITVVGICGLAIMLGGSLVLRKGAGLDQELVGFFMFFTFLLTGLTEVMLLRNLSKLVGQSERKHLSWGQQTPLELRPSAPHTLGENVPSVTENTTRTLEYARREHGK